jgi:hypothetical protein
MTKAIWVLIILVVGYVGYLFYQQWEKARGGNAERPDQAAGAIVHGDSLPGMPSQLETSYRVSKEKGPVAFHTWFTANQKLLADPRKAWIELELCVALSRENPAEAKRIYAAVKTRVPPSSPVASRLKDLERTFGQ